MVCYLQYMSVVKIENNTGAYISLFPTESFPSGVRLGPGLNTVPALFLEEFRARSVRGEGKNAKEIFPGQVALADLLAPVSYFTVAGRQFGPRITIYTDDQAGREDGPNPPFDLRGYSEEQALVAVRVTKDPKVLKRWLTDSRQKIKEAVRGKLAEIG